MIDNIYENKPIGGQNHCSHQGEDNNTSFFLWDHFRKIIPVFTDVLFSENKINQGHRYHTKKQAIEHDI